MVVFATALTAALLWLTAAFAESPGFDIAFGLLLLVAPSYLAFGFAALAWAGFLTGPLAIWVPSITNGLLYGLAGITLSGPSGRSSLRRLTAFLSMVSGLPFLFALVTWSTA